MVAVLTTLVMIAIIGLSFWESPLVSGIGIAVFLLGLPLYGLIVLLWDRPGPNTVMGE